MKRAKRPMVFKFKDLENLLVCPGSRTPLIQDDDWLVCLNPDCRLKYAIRDEIPIMLVDEAVKLSPEGWGNIMQRHSRDAKTGQAIGASP
jgi:uncharacterized protein YbaR (Trm112 family)